MNQLINISTIQSELKQLLLRNANIKGEFILIEINGECLPPYQKESYVINMLWISIITKGWSKISIDHEQYTLNENSLTILISNHKIQFIEKSNDFKAKVLMVDSRLFDASAFNIQTESYLYIHKHPVLQFSAEDIADLSELFDLLMKKTERMDISSNKKTVHCLILAYFCEIAEIANKKTKISLEPSFSHKENIYRKFVLLLHDHVKKERNVSFYANELCITPQYLSSVLKEQSGITASKWIDNMLVTEAKTQLKFTQKNVQQIANELHFPDQSSFGKFFKKMTGYSPKSYKKTDHNIS